MDEMVIRSDFMKSLISKLITKAVFGKTGVSPKITFKSPIQFQKDENYVDLDLDIHVSLSTDDLSKLLKDLV